MSYLTLFPTMRLSRLLLIPLLGLLAGCNYVHFGRLPSAASDAAVAQENADLRSEKKLLQQELALTRREGETLRAALEAGRAGTADAALSARLSETTRELATLRASYAQLETERARLAAAPAAAARSSASSAQEAELNARLAATEEKLAASLRSFTSLREETEGLRTAVQRAQAENSQLTVQVQSLTAKNEDARAALAQLNTELLAQKDARARAAQEADAARSQLATVLAASRASSAASATSPGAARTNSAASAATLNAPGLPDSDAPATPRLSTSRERLAAASVDPTPAEAEGRTHVIVAGETLEKLALKYYGNVEKWRVLYAANNDQLSLGRSLKVGMVLKSPAR